jgi:GNAT superfamily N-acetyltransferase
MTSLRVTRPDDPAARPLLEGLASHEVDEFVPPRGVFLVALSGATTVAGGGVAPLFGDVAEVKRMWTSQQHRRRGLARRVLAALEIQALELGYRVVRLQTGAISTPAVALYHDAGYRRIAPFGPYRDEPLAVAFEKRLVD